MARMHAGWLCGSSAAVILAASLGGMHPAAAAQEGEPAAPMQRLVAGAGAREFSGIYPHLAYYNSQGECGTGAVVPWAGRLWWVTYSPHQPRGSDDRLYATDSELNLFAWPHSVGGTPANRMVHRETRQLLIGPYVIDERGTVRVIPPAVMPGRLTGNARHLTDPGRKVYYATMEEGFYEVDVRTLAVTELFPDAHALEDRAGPLLPGYHGKGLYSGQGWLIYANNGESGPLARVRPDIESGVLAQWSGEGPWHVVRRNQFTEVTGPGGIGGNDRPETDPVWSVGWDHRSLIVMLLDGGRWHAFRLPKASHCYDGAHGWNTEWPRIREIGEDDLLMTMHGMLWRFPRTFQRGAAAGIAPRSTYLKVVADFCRWQDRVVFACDDAAKNEFLNTRKAKGALAGPEVSQSNLWFVPPERIDRLGPAIGRGAVWLDERVVPDTPSEPFLFGGFMQRSVHVVHDGDAPVEFRFELDRAGDGAWAPYVCVTARPGIINWLEFPAGGEGQWIRVTCERACTATVWFEMRNPDTRPAQPDACFDGLARADAAAARGGIVRAGDFDTGLQVLATHVTEAGSRAVGYYELKSDLSLVPVASDRKMRWMAENAAIPAGVLEIDGASVLYVDDDESRYRLPIGHPAYARRGGLLDLQRTTREVVTERDLFQAAGTFYELPARNAGGFAKIRPVATHPYFVQDYCSWRGLCVLSGVAEDAADSPHIVRSADGLCAVWLGTVDDLWSLGKPTGEGGPWRDTAVKAGESSDPFLMAGFDRKTLALSHASGAPVDVDVDADVSGAGLWRRYRRFTVPPGAGLVHEFPGAFHAYWVRFTAHADARVTAHLTYR